MMAHRHEPEMIDVVIQLGNQEPSRPASVMTVAFIVSSFHFIHVKWKEQGPLHQPAAGDGVVS